MVQVSTLLREGEILPPLEEASFHKTFGEFIQNQSRRLGRMERPSVSHNDDNSATQARRCTRAFSDEVASIFKSLLQLNVKIRPLVPGVGWYLKKNSNRQCKRL